MRRVIVMGAGGVGFHLSVCLAQDGVDFTVYDADTLEGGSGAQRLPSGAAKTRKVDLLRGFIRVSMGRTPPTVVPEMFDLGPTPEKGWLEDALVVDCTDMPLEPRKELWAKCKKRGARMLRVSYDGARGGIVTVVEGLPMYANKEGGYEDRPDLALSYAAGGIGARAVKEILSGKAPKYVSFQVNLGELIGSEKAETVVI